MALRFFLIYKDFQTSVCIPSKGKTTLREQGGYVHLLTLSSHLNLPSWYVRLGKMALVLFLMVWFLSFGSQSRVALAALELAL